jgi:SNF2-related domain
MVAVTRDRSGFVKIDWSDDKCFGKDEGLSGELTAGLFVEKIAENYLLVDDGGQLVSVIEYIRELLNGRGIDVEIDKAILGEVDRIGGEDLLVQSIRQQEGQKTDKVKRPKFARPLLPHQLNGLSHALRVSNPANFSVPGSGKTAVALATYATLKTQGIVDRLFVLGPASSFAPWEEEYEATFGVKAASLRVVGPGYRRAEQLRDVEQYDLILCTYHMAHRERANLKRALQQCRSFLLLDEAHYIKSIEAKPFSSTALELAPVAVRRMILTGTPAPHSLKDLWSQFTFLWPNETLLGSRETFETLIDTATDNRVLSSKLALDLKPFFFRTKKSELDLPDTRTNFAPIPMKDIPKRQRVIIRLLELKTVQQAKALNLSGQDIKIFARWRRARAIRLLQACSNPALLSADLRDLLIDDGSFSSDSAFAGLLSGYLDAEIPAKIDWVARKAAELVSSGRKVVIWATFVGNILLLEKLLKEFNPLKAYGGVPAYEEEDDLNQESRERNIREFKTRLDRPILIANPGACSESISLHMVCQDAIYLERNFNCGQFLQSLDRIHRVKMPKNRPPTYHIPLLPCAIEKSIDRRLRDRQQVLYDVLNDDVTVLGFDPDSTALDDESDLEAIFSDVLKEIESAARKRPA